MAKDHQPKPKKLEYDTWASDPIKYANLILLRYICSCGEWSLETGHYTIDVIVNHNVHTYIKTGNEKVSPQHKLQVELGKPN